ncbi:uncharacterized protein BJX67DRAFT_377515 [Aspergillus lucknowensis]|uniref:AAA+ ATPase domain-containing protein n=1 Tax=Aspergillus lucknowensis TaxID=176173 RepID=A0ABR4M260_9EURO
MAPNLLGLVDNPPEPPFDYSGDESRLGDSDLDSGREPLVLQPVVTRLVASDFAQVLRPPTSFINVYYRNAVPDAAASGPKSLSEDRIRALETNTDHPWVIQFCAPILIAHAADVLGIPEQSFRRPFNFTAPFKALVAFQERDVGTADGDAGHLSDARRCLKEVMDVDLRYLFSLRTSLSEGSLKKICFPDLWHLFRPGELVVSVRGGHEQLYRVLAAYHSSERSLARRPPSVRYRRRRPAYSDSDNSETSESDGEEDPELAFFVCGAYLDFDGVLVGPTSDTVSIHYFHGEKDIEQLNIFPIKFLPPGSGVLDRLTARGKRFISCQGHLSYNGMTVRPFGTRVPTVELQGEIYVDFKTGYRAIPSRYRPRVTRSELEELFDLDAPEAPTRREVERERGRTEESRAWTKNNSIVDKALALQVLDRYSNDLQTVSLEEAAGFPPELLRLLPYQLLAYAFRARKWYFVDVDLVEEMDKSDAGFQSGFDDLVIPETYRDLLIALVQSHASKNKQKPSMDLVRGKGRGLFILLHGPPGVGKTSTAELIATYTQRPLYSITCGDIGLTPRQIERRMSKHFSLANKWGCVLLLDEADVFLMKRDWRDINRNALVSVFLRVLEYYSGILFLTTNRIGVIDEAFKSRVHICLRYPSITLTSTLSIWENLLNRITRENTNREVKVTFNKGELLEFAQKHYKHHIAAGTTWNGRQIRNAFQTAIALGEHDRSTRIQNQGLTEEEAVKQGDARYTTVKLTRKNFQKIAKTAKDFEDYMVSVRGSDISIAQEESLRDDRFDPDKRVTVQKQYGGLLSVPAGTQRARSQSGASSSRFGGAIAGGSGDDMGGGDSEFGSSDGESDDDY